MLSHETSEHSITTGSIWKPLLLFFFPILFGTFFQQFYTTIDTITTQPGYLTNPKMN